MIIAALLLAATAPAAAPAEPARITLQQRFNQAKDHALGGRCTDAVPEFEAIETSSPFRNGTIAGAMLAVLKGQCLVGLGRGAEGEEAILQGLPRLRQEGDTFTVDVASALLSLGDAAMMRWDYAGARTYFEQARAIPNATNPAIMNLKLAQATAFDGGTAPLAYAEAAFQSARTTPGITKDRLAEFRSLRARVLLNQGRNEEAYRDLKEALQLSGGLGLRVGMADIILRGDLALAARLAGDDANARKYLAYTGAGRIAESPFARALNMNVPVCGEETGLRAEDFAVVDFAIGQDGRVIGARTVYTRGSAEVAARFAQAVGEWVWDAETIKNIPPVFLFSTRVEVRCTTAGAQVPGLHAPIEQRFYDWAIAQLGWRTGEGRAATATKLRATTLPNDSAKRVAYLGLRTITEPLSEAAKRDLLQQAIAASNAGTVPVETRNYLTVAHHRAEARAQKGRRSDLASYRAQLALLNAPGIVGDALAEDTIRMLAATPYDKRAQLENATQLLEQVAGDKRLEDLHPLRQAANLRLADKAAQQKDWAKAQTYFEATGLTEEQCSLLGLTPVNRTAPISFPQEAYEYGFEGWLSMEFDVQADGTTAAVRPIIAYPPFVFTKAATTGLSKARFEASYRPRGGQACSAQNRGVAFSLAR